MNYHSHQVKMFTLKFINNFAEKDAEKLKFLEDLDESGATKILSLYLAAKHTEEVRDLILHFQRVRLKALSDERNIPFDPENPGLKIFVLLY